MYRYLFRTVFTARTSSASVNESCVLLAKRDHAAAPVCRAANGGVVKALSTSSVLVCERKTDASSSLEDEKSNAEKEADPTETPPVVTQKAEDDSEIKEADDVGTTPQQTDVKVQKGAAAPKQVTTEAVKGGKENLLELLGAMKVDVTSKKKLRELKGKPSSEYVPKSKPADMESTISMFQQATEEAASQSLTLDPELVAAASHVASTLPNKKQVESELLMQLRQNEALTQSQKKGDMGDLGVIIADMRVGRNPNRQSVRSANQIRFDDDGLGYKHGRGITAELDGVRRRKALFSGKRLNIFSPTPKGGVEPTDARPTLWDTDFAYQLSTSINQLPRNELEEMIQWTKEGKLWQYPINNEAGLDEEASVSFHEHIFLEKHLEEGFPQQGPLRHFMELVVTGLSRNPFLTVQQKKDHIFWFRDYFRQKEDVLKDADIHLN